MTTYDIVFSKEARVLARAMVRSHKNWKTYSAKKGIVSREMLNDELVEALYAFELVDMFRILARQQRLSFKLRPVPINPVPVYAEPKNDDTLVSLFAMLEKDLLSINARLQEDEFMRAEEASYDDDYTAVVRQAEARSAFTAII